MPDVGDHVVGVLEADGDADEAVADALRLALLGRERGSGGGGGVNGGANGSSGDGESRFAAVTNMFSRLRPPVRKVWARVLLDGKPVALPFCKDHTRPGSDGQLCEASTFMAQMRRLVPDDLEAECLAPPSARA